MENKQRDHHSICMPISDLFVVPPPFASICIFEEKNKQTNKFYMFKGFFIQLINKDYECYYIPVYM